MTFATDALKPDSERFVLLKIAPRKYVGLGTLTTANTYTFATGLSRVDAVEINGAVDDVTSFSFSNGTLTVVSSLNLASGNVVTATFYLLVTGRVARDTIGNTASLPEEIWEPLIESYPQFSLSMRNIGEGVFSIANTDVSLLSPSRALHAYFGSTFSWNRAEVTAWVCIDSVNTVRNVFTGSVTSAQLTSGKVSLSIADTFQQLTKTATFGTRAQSYIYTGHPSATEVQPADENAPQALALGKTSPMFVAPGYRISEAFGTPATIQMYHLSDGLKCRPLTANLDVATSVTFSCGRIIGSTVKTIHFGTIVRAYRHYVVKTLYNDTSTHYINQEFMYLKASQFTGKIGDAIPLNSRTLNVCAIGAFTHAGNDYDVALVYTDYFYDTSVSLAGTSAAISVPSFSEDTYPSMSLWVEGEGPASYTLSNLTIGLIPSFATASYSGHYIPFSLSMGTPYSMGGETVTQVFAIVTSSSIGDRLPGRLNIKCRFTPQTSMGHGEAMEFVLKSAGMSTNAPAAANADAVFPANVSMCIPSFGSNEYPSYLAVAQSITSSTLGLVRLNANRDAEYHLIDDLEGSGTIGSRTATNILEGETNSNVDYQDLQSLLKFENPNLIEPQSSSVGPSASIDTPLARYLHKSDSVRVINHVLDNIYNRYSIIASHNAAPKVEYSFSTSSEDLTTNIGDMLDFVNPAVAASSETTTGMAVSLQSNGSKTNVVINELRGI